MGRVAVVVKARQLPPAPSCTAAVVAAPVLSIRLENVAVEAVRLSQLARPTTPATSGASKVPPSRCQFTLMPREADGGKDCTVRVATSLVAEPRVLVATRR